MNFQNALNSLICSYCTKDVLDRMIQMKNMIKLTSPRTTILLIFICLFHTIIAQGQSRDEFLETTAKSDPSMAVVDSIFVDASMGNYNFWLLYSPEIRAEKYVALMEERIALGEKLQREVEAELRKSQINVSNERSTVRGHPHLVVSVLFGDPFEGHTKMFPFVVFWGFRQKVMLQRQPNVSVPAFTWQRLAIGHATRENIFASIVETTLAKVNEFNIIFKKSK